MEVHRNRSDSKLSAWKKKEKSAECEILFNVRGKSMFKALAGRGKWNWKNSRQGYHLQISRKPAMWAKPR